MTMASTSHPVTDRGTAFPDGGSRRTVTAELVAGIVNGVPSIGEACALLRKAGWHATIAANRVTVDDEVFAQFIGASSGPHGPIEARWLVYRIAGASPVWIVGTQRTSHAAEETSTGTGNSISRLSFDGHRQPGLGVAQ
jgi:hypothetical protein